MSLLVKRADFRWETDFDQTFSVSYAARHFLFTEMSPVETPGFDFGSFNRFPLGRHNGEQKIESFFWFSDGSSSRVTSRIICYNGVRFRLTVNGL